jgi:hypothetical protein
MNSARLVMTNVQMVRDLPFMAGLPSVADLLVL